MWMVNPVVSAARGSTRGLLLGLVLWSVLLAGCSSNPPASSQSGGATPSAAADTALNPISQNTLQALVDKTAADLGIPGALVLIRSLQGAFVSTTGTTELGTIKPPQANTNFRIASNTKTMTAALILQLVEEKKLSLSTPVSSFVAGVPGGDKISIAQLLEMRSGLFNYTDAPQVSAELDRNPSRVWTTAELLSIAFGHPPVAPPGTFEEDNNTNYVLLGVVVEKIDRKPLKESMRDRLFEPQGLGHTFLPTSTDGTLPDPYSHGYLYGSTSVALRGEPRYTSADKAAAAAGSLRLTDYTNLNPSFTPAPAGVISTADDCASWIEALIQGRVLDAPTTRAMLSSPARVNPDKPLTSQYGYGLARAQWGANSIYFHSGETPGYASTFSYDPANQLTVVVWTNQPIALDGQQTAQTLWRRVLNQIYAHPWE